MMGVQILEGDWNAEVEVAAASGGNANPNKNPSARQRRWTAFRSWYRGGRVFDRADETLIAAAMLRRPPSPGSQGRPLTPRLTPADGPRPAAPTTFGEEEVATAPATAAGTGGDGTEEGETAAAAADPPEPSDGVRAEVEKTAAADKGKVPGPVTPLAGVMRGRRTTPPVPPEPPGAGGGGSTFRVTLLKTDQSTRARTSSREDAAAAADGPVENGRASTEADGVLQEQQDRGIDTARLAGIAGWDAGEDNVQADGEAGTIRLEFGGDEEGDGLGCGGATAMPTMSREGGTAAAKRLRMEARRKFLAARTVTSTQAARKVRMETVHLHTKSKFHFPSNFTPSSALYSPPQLFPTPQKARSDIAICRVKMPFASHHPPAGLPSNISYPRSALGPDAVHTPPVPWRVFLQYLPSRHNRKTYSDILGIDYLPRKRRSAGFWT